MDLSSLKKNLPNNWDTSVILKSSQKNINLVTFIITGPKDTPYQSVRKLASKYIDNLKQGRVEPRSQEELRKEIFLI